MPGSEAASPGGHRLMATEYPGPGSHKSCSINAGDMEEVLWDRYPWIPRLLLQECRARELGQCECHHRRMCPRNRES